MDNMQKQNRTTHTPSAPANTLSVRTFAWKNESATS